MDGALAACAGCQNVLAFGSVVWRHSVVDILTSTPTLIRQSTRTLKAGKKDFEPGVALGVPAVQKTKSQAPRSG